MNQAYPEESVRKPEGAGKQTVILHKESWIRHLVFTCVVTAVLLVWLDTLLYVLPVIDSSIVRRIFNMGTESSLITWFATVQSGLVAVTLFSIFFVLRQQEDKHWGTFFWLLFGFFFLFMSIDDTARIHERVGSTLGNIVRADSQNHPAILRFLLEFTYSWQIFLMPIFAAMGVLMLFILWRQLGPFQLRKYLVLGLTCFALAVGIDFVEGIDGAYSRIAKSLQVRDFFVEHYFRVLEEFLEVFGQTMCLLCFLRYLASITDNLQFRIQPGVLRRRPAPRTVRRVFGWGIALTLFIGLPAMAYLHTQQRGVPDPQGKYALPELPEPNSEVPEFTFWSPTHPSPKDLLGLVEQRLILAGDYLARSVQEDGAYRYEYEPDTDTYPNKYNIVRHAGTTYALYQIYGHTGHQHYADAAERAVAWMQRHIYRLQEADAAYLANKNRVKLGAVALAVVALVERWKTTGQTDLNTTMQRLGDFLIWMQRADGRFMSYYYRNEKRKNETVVSPYYPGESLLALSRLYLLFGEEKWKTAAEKAADYLVFVRDKDKWNDPVQDYWLSTAIADLYPFLPKDAYAMYAYKIGEKMQASLYTPETARTYSQIGGKNLGYREEPTTVATATNGEGLYAIWKLAVRNRRDARIFSLGVHQAAHFTLSHQFTSENTQQFKNPERAIGGLPKSDKVPMIRIDYVQHNITAWLGLVDMLKRHIGKREDA